MLLGIAVGAAAAAGVVGPRLALLHVLQGSLVGGAAVAALTLLLLLLLLLQLGVAPLLLLLPVLLLLLWPLVVLLLLVIVSKVGLLLLLMLEVRLLLLLLRPLLLLLLLVVGWIATADGNVVLLGLVLVGLVALMEAWLLVAVLAIGCLKRRKVEIVPKKEDRAFITYLWILLRLPSADLAVAPMSLVSAARGPNAKGSV